MPHNGGEKIAIAMDLVGIDVTNESCPTFPVSIVNVTIRDLSETGARVETLAPIHLPDRFSLLDTLREDDLSGSGALAKRKI